MVVLRRSMAVLVVLMLLLLPVVSTGCGSPAADEDDPGETAEPVESEEQEKEEEEPADEKPVSIDEWRNPAGVHALVSDFEVLEWTWTGYENGEETSTTKMLYRFEGMEQIGDDECSRLFLGFDDTEIVMWLDEDGEAIQAESDGELVPDEFSGMMLNPLLNAAFWPFTVARQFRVPDVVMGRRSGWATNVLSTGSRQVGDLQADVIEMKVEIGPPHTEEGEEAEVIWVVGDFGDFQMLLEWSSPDTGLEDASFNLEVTRVVPR